MSQALYRKWRPHLWNKVVGQDHIVQTLQNAIRTDRVGHAYLFAGPRGTGKTTTARLLAKAVNCLSPDLEQRPCNQCEHCIAVNENRFLDLIEIDAASNTSVDDIRDLREKINYSPSQGKFKVYIIDEVHMLSTAAFNALLKTLEEPPAHAIFILATTEVHKIPATVLSRCQRHEFRRIPVSVITAYLKEMAAEEGLAVEEEALTLIARQSTGSMRDAISLLDQMASTGSQITLELSQTVLGTATNQSVIELIDAILAQKAADGLNCIHQALDSGTDPRQFARQIVDYLRNLMLLKMGNADQVDVLAEQKKKMTQQAKAFELDSLVNTLRLFNTAANESRIGWQPGLAIELALAEALESKSSDQMSDAPQPKPVTASVVRNSGSMAVEHRVVVEPVESMPVEKAQKVPSEATQQQAPTEIRLQTILEAWPKIRTVVKKRRMQTEAVLNSCRDIKIRDGVLILAFASPVLKDKMEKDDNIKLTCEAIKQVIGYDIPIRCVVTDKNNTVPEDLDYDADGMVGTALDLGAKIVDKE